MISVARWTLPAVLGLALLPACSRHRGGDEGRTGTAGETTVTGARLGIASEAAVERIVAARCSREAACSNIGVDKRFTDQTVCAHEVRARMREDLKPSECPGGIDTRELDECISAIRAESCNNPLETLSRMSACKTSDLCSKGR